MSSDHLDVWLKNRFPLEKWAEEAGVRLEGHTVVEDGDRYICTAFGPDRTGKIHRNSIVVTKETHGL